MTRVAIYDHDHLSSVKEPSKTHVHLRSMTTRGSQILPSQIRIPIALFHWDSAHCRGRIDMLFRWTFLFVNHCFYDIAFGDRERLSYKRETTERTQIIPKGRGRGFGNDKVQWKGDTWTNTFAGCRKGQPIQAENWRTRSSLEGTSDFPREQTMLPTVVKS